MKKFHFGHGITLVLLIFIAFLATVFVKSQRMNHTLVVDDYYAKDLAYQKTYEKMSNALTEKKDFDLKWNKGSKTHILSFTDKEQKRGTIRFYRPSDSSLDFEIKFDSKEDVEINQMIVPGKWTIISEWNEAKGVDYLVEKTMIIGV
jgi:hypothetical protein